MNAETLKVEYARLLRWIAEHVKDMSVSDAELREALAAHREASWMLMRAGAA